MSLLDVQRSMVGFTRGSLTAYQGCDNLTHAEYKWLNTLLHSPGLQVTQQIQQWWRIARVCATAPLTIELLKRNGLEELIINYITTEPVHSLFFAAELQQFKQVLQRNPQVDATTNTMIEFEAALKNAYQASVSHEPAKAIAKATLGLHFTRDPIKLFTTLLTGTDLPAADGDYYVIISATLAQHWCLATEADYLSTENKGQSSQTKINLLKQNS